MKSARRTNELASRAVNKFPIAWVEPEGGDFGSERITERRHWTAPGYDFRLGKAYLVVPFN